MRELGVARMLLAPRSLRVLQVLPNIPHQGDRLLLRIERRRSRFINGHGKLKTVIGLIEERPIPVEHEAGLLILDNVLDVLHRRILRSSIGRTVHATPNDLAVQRRRGAPSAASAGWAA